jgi:hypothetical protein
MHEEAGPCPASFFSRKEATMKKIIPLMISVLLLLFLSVASAADKRVTVPLGDSPSMGPENAPVAIVEFIDFQ